MMQRPSTEAIEGGLAFLKAHEALTAEERITPLGFVLSLLPVDFIIAKMLVLGTVWSSGPPEHTAHKPRKRRPALTVVDG